VQVIHTKKWDLGNGLQLGKIFQLDRQCYRRKRTKTIHGTGEAPRPHLGLKLQRPPRPCRKVRRGDEPDSERCVAVVQPSIVKTLASCRHRQPSHYQCAAIPQFNNVLLCSA
jgi:hypothetical protein